MATKNTAQETPPSPEQIEAAELERLIAEAEQAGAAQIIRLPNGVRVDN